MNGLKVLVVDDNEEFCHNLKDILEMKEYMVETAYDGPAALDLVKNDSFDLILMDVKMPVMNGVETLKELRKLTPDTPVIMMTAYAVEELIKEALYEGAFGSIKKPLDFNSLFELLERASSDGMMILLVDDDENLCASLKDVLVQKGYNVSVAYDGDSALRMAQENDYKMMLLDMKLPPLNGLETFLSVKEFRPDIVTIIITGYAEEKIDLVNQALNKNAYTCLTKPLNMEDLITLLNRVGEEKTKENVKRT